MYKLKNISPTKKLQIIKLKKIKSSQSILLPNNQLGHLKNFKQKFLVIKQSSQRLESPHTTSSRAAPLTPSLGSIL